MSMNLKDYVEHWERTYGITEDTPVQLKNDLEQVKWNIEDAIKELEEIDPHAIQDESYKQAHETVSANAFLHSDDYTGAVEEEAGELWEGVMREQINEALGWLSSS